MINCPCNPAVKFADCCQPFLQGDCLCQTPVELMRSRYSAFVCHNSSYLLATWHKTTKPQDLDLTNTPEWLGLQIIKTSITGEKGFVEFRASFRSAGGLDFLHESSCFVYESGQWLYVDGKIHPGQRKKDGRNQPCSCGSGKKYKRCCG